MVKYSSKCPLLKKVTLTLIMTSTQIVEMSLNVITNTVLLRKYIHGLHLDDHLSLTYDTILF